MRKFVLAAAWVSAFAALTAVPAQAIGVRYPFCIQGDEYPGFSACYFETYEQCQATASGRRLYCLQNPFYAGDNDRRSYLNVPPRARREGNFFELFIH
ncbi:DUF3551 domain-containing protein [Bradyrhizobium lablabi]|uniref:DUF3551 domain-containing protein n=1 Tax=Bradyrhizobium lablabi TaxID=722472 RepID=UPI0020135877|nr:DUF3551 domain-containing protein [Bradyrhizobium lablabi]